MMDDEPSTDADNSDRGGATGDSVLPGGAPARRLGAGAGRWLGRCFYACGDKGVPLELRCLGGRYVLERVLKHDFVAATVLYRLAPSQPDLPARLVCKIGRRMHFCLVPLNWLGRLVTHNEVRNLRRCEGLPEVTKVLARPSPDVYIYEYIEGVDLGAKPTLPADFFDRLLAAVRAVHARNVVHVDLHKPGNILVDRDGRPHLIDFQLSRHIGDRALLSMWLSRRFRTWLQSYDIYHICKHKRRLQPDLLTEGEDRLSRNQSLPLQIHRTIAKPYKRIRRACLRYLHAKGILAPPESSETCSETSPGRWARK